MTNREATMDEVRLPCFRKKPKRRLVTQEGYPYIFLGAILTSVVWGIFGFGAALPLLLVTLYIIGFFRNPKRGIPVREDLIVAPADGRVLEVTACEENKYLKRRATRISIFMSPFNCHINRSPVDGKVLDCFYKPGRFKAAFKRKAMERNEHHAILLEDKSGRRWLVVQIAGFLARRIVSYVQSGFSLKRGQRLGLIQFGSRTDLYCPPHCEIYVKKGQKVYGGTTVLGRID